MDFRELEEGLQKISDNQIVHSELLGRIEPRHDEFVRRHEAWLDRHEKTLDRLERVIAKLDEGTISMQAGSTGWPRGGGAVKPDCRRQDGNGN
jgi:hypothetical protein